MPDTFNSLGFGPLNSKHCAPLLSTRDETYLRLLSEFCVAADIRVPESVLSGEEFCVDRVDFRFRVDQEKAPGVLNIWCDFGPVDEADQLKCYRALLERGTRYRGPFASTMAVCLETGWVLCCARVSLDALSSPELLAYVRSLASEALLWQGLERMGSNVQDTPATSIDFAD